MKKTKNLLVRVFDAFWRFLRLLAAASTSTLAFDILWSTDSITVHAAVSDFGIGDKLSLTHNLVILDDKGRQTTASKFNNCII